jgi:hypothetical protein
MRTGSTLPRSSPKTGAGRRSHGSGATIIINAMECLLWGAIRDKARSERCEG